jgi:predicted Zn-dependent protease
MKKAKKSVKGVAKKAKKPARKPAKVVRKPAKVPKPVKRQVKKTTPKPAKKPKNAVYEFTQMLKMEPEKKVVKPYPVLEGAASERVTMLLPILRDMVRRNIISDWIINVTHIRSANLYVERNFNIEDELIGIKEDVNVTIFERYSDGTMGEAQLQVITLDTAMARAQIMDAKHTCQFTKKKAFNLAQPEEGIYLPQSYDEKMLAEHFAGNGSVVTHHLYDHIKTIMSTQDVKTNSFEILTSAGTMRVINSNGVDISHHKTMVYLELVLSAKAEEEREFLLSKIAVSPEQLDLQGLLLQQVQIVKDATIAKPNPGFKGNVLFSGQSVTEFFAPHHDFNPLIIHAFAKFEHMGLSSLKINQPLGHFQGEPFSITSNPSLPHGLATAPVDEEGTPLRPVEIIRNGTFVNFIATQRYAQYLNVPATGMVANIQVSPGATREEHLRGNDYFEIVSFSWFNPNSFSGDVSAEIRLGYHWVNGRRTPFRGGTFTGNIFKSLLNARFSKEVMQSGMYYGPRVVVFKDATITRFE